MVELLLKARQPYCGGHRGRVGQDAAFLFSMEGEYADYGLCDAVEDLYSLGPGKEASVAYAILEKKTKGERDLAREAILAVTSAALSVVRDIERIFEKKQPKDQGKHSRPPVCLSFG